MTVENVNLSSDSPVNIKKASWRKKGAIASVSVASFLVVAKIIAYLNTGSIALMTSLVDSAIDLIASSITLFSVIRAALPPNKKHRYGFDKIESLAAMAQAIFIFSSAGYILYQSVERLVTPQEIFKLDVALWVMVLSIFMTMALIKFQNYVIVKTRSVAIKADSLHYKGDLLMNTAVIISLVITQYTGLVKVDAIFGVLVAVILLKSSYDIFKEALGVLIDRELSEEERQTIISLVKEHHEVTDVHDLRTRHSGYRTFIEFHMEVYGGMDLFKVHDITEEIEREIYDKFPDADILIHPEPHGIDDYKRDRKIEEGENKKEED